MPGNLSTRETRQAQWCAGIALAGLSLFLLACGWFIWSLYFGPQVPDAAAGITEELGSGIRHFFVPPWQKIAFLLIIFLSVLISAAPTFVFHLAYRQWPTLPEPYARVLSVLFGILALYIVVSTLGWI